MWRRHEHRYLQCPDVSSCRSKLYGDVDEDYWEDASVSLKSARDWELSTIGRAEPEMNLEVKATPWSLDRRPWIETYSSPSMRSFEEDPAPLKHRRSFPPPVVSCATLSFKEGGRLVLKEACARPLGFFLAQRENGRFCLKFIQPLATDEEGTEGEGDADEGEEEEEVPLQNDLIDEYDTRSDAFPEASASNSLDAHDGRQHISDFGNDKDDNVSPDAVVDGAEFIFMDADDPLLAVSSNLEDRAKPKCFAMAETHSFGAARTVGKDALIVDVNNLGGGDDSSSSANSSRISGLSENECQSPFSLPSLLSLRAMEVQHVVEGQFVISAGASSSSSSRSSNSAVRRENEWSPRTPSSEFGRMWPVAATHVPLPSVSSPSPPGCDEYEVGRLRCNSARPSEDNNVLGFSQIAYNWKVIDDGDGGGGIDLLRCGGGRDDAWRTERRTGGSGSSVNLWPFSFQIFLQSALARMSHSVGLFRAIS